jgi:hypothetical protein
VQAALELVALPVRQDVLVRVVVAQEVLRNTRRQLGKRRELALQDVLDDILGRVDEESRCLQHASLVGILGIGAWDARIRDHHKRHHEVLGVGRGRARRKRFPEHAIEKRLGVLQRFFVLSKFVGLQIGGKQAPLDVGRKLDGRQAGNRGHCRLGA